MKRQIELECKGGKEVMDDMFLKVVSLSFAFLAIYYPVEVIKVGYGKKKLKKEYLSFRGYRILGFSLLLLGIVANIFIIGALFNLFN